MTAQPCDPPEFQPDEPDVFATTRKHFLEPDPQDSTSCKRCGSVDGWGVLHLTERGEFDYDDPQPEPCPDGCPHYRHSGPCTGGYPGGAACRCGSTP